MADHRAARGRPAEISGGTGLSGIRNAGSSCQRELHPSQCGPPALICPDDSPAAGNGGQGQPAPWIAQEGVGPAAAPSPPCYDLRACPPGSFRAVRAPNRSIPGVYGLLQICPVLVRTTVPLCKFRLFLAQLKTGGRLAPAFSTGVDAVPPLAIWSTRLPRQASPNSAARVGNPRLTARAGPLSVIRCLPVYPLAVAGRLRASPGRRRHQRRTLRFGRSRPAGRLVRPGQRRRRLRPSDLRFLHLRYRG